MFVLAKERLAWWPVTFPSVADDGVVIENRIELRFMILGEDLFPAFITRLTQPLAQPLANASGDVLADTEVSEVGAHQAADTAALDALLEVVRDWRHVAGENGEPLPFNRDNFGLLLNVPNAAGAIGRAYIACRMATPEIRQGN